MIYFSDGKNLKLPNTRLEEASNDPEYGQKKSATTDQSNSANSQD